VPECEQKEAGKSSPTDAGGTIKNEAAIPRVQNKEILHTLPASVNGDLRFATGDNLYLARRSCPP